MHKPLSLTRTQRVLMGDSRPGERCVVRSRSLPFPALTSDTASGKEGKRCSPALLLQCFHTWEWRGRPKELPNMLLWFLWYCPACSHCLIFSPHLHFLFIGWTHADVFRLHKHRDSSSFNTSWNNRREKQWLAMTSYHGSTNKSLLLKHGRRPVNAEIQSDDNGVTEEELTNMRDSSSEDVKAAGPELGL